MKRILAIMIVLMLTVLHGAPVTHAQQVTNEAVPTSSWTHKDLVAYLQSKGLKVSTRKAVETNPDRTFGGPGLMLVIPGGEVYAQLRKSADEAREVRIRPERYSFVGSFLLRGKSSFSPADCKCPAFSRQRRGAKGNKRGSADCKLDSSRTRCSLAVEGFEGLHKAGGRDQSRSDF